METVLHDVLKLGVDSGASDVHIKAGAPVHYRIDAGLAGTDYVTEEAMVKEFIHQVAEPHLLDKYRETGDLDLSVVEDGVGRFRLNIHRQRGVDAMTFRHVKSKIPNFHDLNLPPVLLELAESERGIILLAGTTGSGKSTTLAAMLQHVNENFSKHIITVEDPIEFEFQDANCIFEQREVGLDTISFDSALVHALRQDPDTIMVGEMRNRTSFDAALKAADTGHLVMSTVHASTATQAIQRILNLYEHHEQAAIQTSLALNIKAIIAQRLVPRVDKGVVPVNEILINTSVVQKLMEDDRMEKLPAALESGGKSGMQTFNQALIHFLDQGLITEEEALKTAENPEQLKMNMKGIFLSSNSIIG